MTFEVKQLLMTNPHTYGAELALGKGQGSLSLFLAALPWALTPRTLPQFHIRMPGSSPCLLSVQSCGCLGKNLMGILHWDGNICAPEGKSLGE